MLFWIWIEGVRTAEGSVVGDRHLNERFRPTGLNSQPRGMPDKGLEIALGIQAFTPLSVTVRMAS